MRRSCEEPACAGSGSWQRPERPRPRPRQLKQRSRRREHRRSGQHHRSRQCDRPTREWPSEQRPDARPACGAPRRSGPRRVPSARGAPPERLRRGRRRLWRRRQQQRVQRPGRPLPSGCVERPSWPAPVRHRLPRHRRGHRRQRQPPRRRAARLLTSRHWARPGPAGRPPWRGCGAVALRGSPHLRGRRRRRTPAAPGRQRRRWSGLTGLRWMPCGVLSSPTRGRPHRQGQALRHRVARSASSPPRMRQDGSRLCYA